MAFIGPDDILALEKDSGKVKRIVNGQMLEDPLIDVNSYHQDGLMGITTTQNQKGSTYVFLYFTEVPVKYGAEVDVQEEAKQVNLTLGYDREGDRLYRYKLVDNKLVDPYLLIDIGALHPNKHTPEKHNEEK